MRNKRFLAPLGILATLGLVALLGASSGPVQFAYRLLRGPNVTLSTNGVDITISATTTISGTAYQFSTVTQAGGTNQHIDLAGATYQTILMTNDVCVLYVTNGPGAVAVKFRPNGANRSVLYPTNWVSLNTNGLTVSGIYYLATITNGPGVGWLSAAADGADPTNTVAAFSWSAPQ